MLVTSAIDGGDQIASNLTLLLIPICLLDKRKNHWYDDVINQKHSLINLKANLFWIVIRIQAAMIYFHASIGKFFATEWANGTAVYYWFNHPVFGMPDFIKPLINYFLVKDWGVTLFTYGTLIFEIFLFMSFFMELKYRKYIFPFAIFFHFSIIIIHGIFSFFFSMAGLLVFYLLDLRNQKYKSL